MGLLFDYAKSLKNKSTILEAEVDGQPVENDDYQTTDYTNTEDDGNYNNQQVNNDNPPAPSQNDQSQEDYNYQYSNSSTTDYTNQPDDGYDDYGDNGQSQSNDNKDQQPEKEVDDLKAAEEEMYANLTPEQLDIKHKELKGQFLEMFDIVSELIDRIGDAGTSEENIKIIEYISNNLINLKDMISDYVNDVYQTKSYIENSIVYNRFLATLNGINRLLEEIQVKDN